MQSEDRLSLARGREQARRPSFGDSKGSEDAGVGTEAASNVVGDEIHAVRADVRARETTISGSVSSDRSDQMAACPMQQSFTTSQFVTITPRWYYESESTPRLACLGATHDADVVAACGKDSAAIYAVRQDNKSSNTCSDKIMLSNLGDAFRDLDDSMGAAAKVLKHSDLNLLACNLACDGENPGHEYDVGEGVDGMSNLQKSKYSSLSPKSKLPQNLPRASSYSYDSSSPKPPPLIARRTQPITLRYGSKPGTLQTGMPSSVLSGAEESASFSSRVELEADKFSLHGSFYA
jgi:hypothetical protein